MAASVYNVEKGATELWVYDTETGTSRRILTGPGITDSARWSPDSTRLVYIRTYGKGLQLYIKGLGEQDQEEALPPAPFQIPTDWSSDGRFIAYTNTAFPMIENDLAGDVWLIDLKNKRKVIPLLNSEARESSLQFSPDGKRVAYIADDSGRPEAYIQGFEGGDSPRLTGERRQLSRGGARYLRWRQDSRELFHLGSGSTVYATSIGRSAGLETGPQVALFQIPVDSHTVIPNGFSFDVSADGQRFLVASKEPGTQSQFVIVQNWEVGLRK